MSYLKAGDTISGQEGYAQATINGKVEKLFALKDLEAIVEKNKTEVKTIGKRGTQHKAIGWSGTGSMTLHYVTSVFRRLMIDYIKNGVDTYFDIVVTNDDPTSTVGKQTTVLYNCNLDSIVVAKLDTEAEALDEELEFTFDDVDILESFVTPSYLK